MNKVSLPAKIALLWSPWNIQSVPKNMEMKREINFSCKKGKGEEMILTTFTTF